LNREAAKTAKARKESKPLCGSNLGGMGQLRLCFVRGRVSEKPPMRVEGIEHYFQILNKAAGPYKAQLKLFHFVHSS
jgi:hypothetical protein